MLNKFVSGRVGRHALCKVCHSDVSKSEAKLLMRCFRYFSVSCGSKELSKPWTFQFSISFICTKNTFNTLMVIENPNSLRLILRIFKGVIRKIVSDIYIFSKGLKGDLNYKSQMLQNLAT